MKRTIGLVTVILALGAPLACGPDEGDDDDDNVFHFDTCPELCSAAQAASCTVVDCDCNQFCVSLEAFKTKGDCGAQATAYESCALAQDPCTVSAGCGSQENAFSTCVLTYCATHQTDSDCTFLVGC